jgi:hypothetical protein
MSVLFDGVNDTIGFSVTGRLRNVSSWTVMAWINATSLPGEVSILNVSVGSPVGTSLSRADLAVLASGAIEITIRRLDADAGIVVTSAAGEIVVGNVYHVAVSCVYGANLTVKFYKNGVLVSTQTPAGTAGSTSDTNSQNGAIGSNDDGASQFFPGYIEDTRVYGRALSDDEIATIYACEGRDGIWVSLQSRHNLNEQSRGTTAPAGATVKDLTDNGYNGTPGAGTAAPSYRENLRIKPRRVTIG